MKGFHDLKEHQEKLEQWILKNSQETLAKLNYLAGGQESRHEPLKSLEPEPESRPVPLPASFVESRTGIETDTAMRTCRTAGFTI